MSEDALRVLGFAMRTLTELPTDDDENVEFDMTFVGVTGMIDPPRKDVADSVHTCRQAGIRTIMITGDHKVTALAIAKELDIYREGNTVIPGEKLDTMSDDELDDAGITTTVFARVTPADILRIIQSLKRTGEVAAMATCAYWIGASMGGHVTGQTMAFCVLAFSQMLKLLNQRSNTEPIWVQAERINAWLILSFVASAILMTCILFVPALQSAFQLTLLDGTQWLIVIGLPFMSILQVEIVKAIKRYIYK